MRRPLIAAGPLPLLILLLLFAPQASADPVDSPTELSGVIDTPTTLDDTGGYLVKGELQVSDLLTIKPGVTLTFTYGSSLYVTPEGALEAVAINNRSIRFVADRWGGKWGGIKIEGAARLRGCEISGAEAGVTLATWDLLDTAPVRLVSCYIENNETGLVMIANADAKQLEDIHILNNSGYAIEYRIPSPSSRPEQIFYPTFTDLYVQGNGFDAVKVDETVQSNANCASECLFRLSSPRLHDGSALPLHLGYSWPHGGNAFLVKPGYTLELPAGVEIAGKKITVEKDGRLTVNGSLAEPVKFTKHPSISWDGVFLQPDSYANIIHCDVSDARNPAFTIESDKVTLTDCRIRDGGSHGIRLGGGGIDPILQRLKIENNAGYAIYQSSLNMQPRYAELDFNGNGVDAIGVGDGSVTGSIDIFPPEGVDGALPFIMEGSTSIADGTLNINEGTTLLAKYSGARITVSGQGTLIANGVTFSRTADLTESWRGIHLQAGATADLTDCAIIGAGTEFEQSGALQIASSDVRVDGCRISGGQSNGVWLYGEGIAPLLSNLTIENNKGYAVYQMTGSMDPEYRNLHAEGNGSDTVRLASMRLIQEQDVTLENPGTSGTGTLPYVVPELYRVSAGATLTVGKDVELRFIDPRDGYGQMIVAGRLVADGATFTGREDTPGAWTGISIEPGATAKLRNSQILYAGWNGDGRQFVQQTAVLIDSTEPVSINHCTIRDSQTAGITTRYGARPDLRSNNIYDNLYGLHQVGAALASSIDAPVDARFTWWGDPSGPVHSLLNPDGKGNRVTGDALFTPWAETPVTVVTQPPSLYLPLLAK